MYDGHTVDVNATSEAALRQLARPASRRQIMSAPLETEARGR